MMKCLLTSDFFSMRRFLAGLCLGSMLWWPGTALPSGDRIKTACNSQLDREALHQLRDHGIRVRRQVRQSCEQGERNRAQNQAIELAMQLQKSAAVIGYRRCRDELEKPLPELDTLLRQFFISTLRFTHSCELVNR